MLDKNLIQSTSSWPLVEIRKLLKERKDIIKANKRLIFKLVMDQWATSYWNIWRGR